MLLPSSLFLVLFISIVIYSVLLYQIWAVQQALGSVTPNFSIAAAFGNVHGVYKPGNVKLNPGILATHQASVKFCLPPLFRSPACYVSPEMRTHPLATNSTRCFSKSACLARPFRPDLATVLPRRQRARTLTEHAYIYTRSFRSFGCSQTTALCFTFF